MIDQPPIARAIRLADGKLVEQRTESFRIAIDGWNSENRQGTLDCSLIRLKSQPSRRLYLLLR